MRYAYELPPSGSSNPPPPPRVESDRPSINQARTAAAALPAVLNQLLHSYQARTAAVACMENQIVNSATVAGFGARFESQQDDLRSCADAIQTACAGAPIHTDAWHSSSHAVTAAPIHTDAWH